MKYRLIRGWTPHEIFEWANTLDYPEAMFFMPDTNDHEVLKICGRIYACVSTSKNQHEALARWLVANTEGDW